MSVGAAGKWDGSSPYDGVNPSRLGKWDGFGPYRGHNPSRSHKVASFGSLCDPK